MTFYFLVLLAIIALGILFEKNNKKIYLYSIFLLFSLVVGLRHYSIGVDTPSYVRIFQNFNYLGISDILNSNSWLEPGFLFFYYFIRLFTHNYTILLLLISGVTNFSICYFVYKKSKNMCVSFLLFILTRLFFSEMNIIRQFLSVAILLFSIRYIEKRSFLKFGVIVLLAAIIHKSSLFFLPFYFLYNYKIGLKSKIIFILISAIVFFQFYPIFVKITTILGGTYTHYVDSFYGSDKLASIIGFVIYLVILLFFEIVDYGSKNDLNNYSKFDGWLYNCQFILTIFCFLSIRMSILSRVTDILSVLLIVSIPNYIAKISKTKTRLLSYVLILFFFTSSMVVVLKYRPNWYNVIPYKFFWNE